MDTAEKRGQLVGPGPIRKYVLGGNSRFTLDGGDLFGRFTYRVKSATHDKGKNWSTGNADLSTYFVSVLTGPDNEASYTYLGLLKRDSDGAYQFGATIKSMGMKKAESYLTFEQFWNSLEHGCQVPSWIDFWHEGVCCVCGRTLTVPESIAAGIGPECASKEGI